MSIQKARKLELRCLDDVVSEIQKLSQTGYEISGNWTLGQICRHLTLDIQSCMDGYPKWVYLFAPLRPVIRKLFLPKILRFESPSGVKTMGKFVPPADLADEQEANAYKAQVERFSGFDGPFHTHPGFGFNQREDLETIYSAHAAHHLSFLAPKSL